MGEGLCLAFAHIISLELLHLSLRWPLLLSLQMRTARLRVQRHTDYRCSLKVIPVNTLSAEVFQVWRTRAQRRSLCEDRAESG